MELLSITLAAGEVKRFERAGRYFEIIDATDSFGVDFYGPMGNLTDSINGAVSGLFLSDPWQSFVVRNGSSAQSVKLLLMETGNGGSRRQPGVVQVVDGGKARSLVGVAGIGTVGCLAAAAARSWVQLWNPAGSGQRLVVKRLKIASASAGIADVRTHNAALTTLNGSPLSKLNQGILNAFEFRSVQDASTLGQGLINTYVQASQTLDMPFEEPLLLSPGFGLLVAQQANNADTRATFEFYCESMV